MLKNTMEKITPKIIDNDTFSVIVSTDLNKDYLDGNNKLMAFLRKRLGNDNINMVINVSENTTVYKPMTSMEVFNEMVKQNPALQKLSDEFDLELS